MRSDRDREQEMRKGKVSGDEVVGLGGEGGAKGREGHAVAVSRSRMSAGRPQRPPLPCPEILPTSCFFSF